ncbi:GntR family transcriptional regulator [Pigmentiphaga litoralis]|uniref:DNA-binding GntR family transcriptional regulator n=1 Tax=Pigmentiphaga litoralis TaxID=516702 RepID=A0A7Y9LLM8_9BURK|nr:GntR family transcriptional regulator [Pigmentiphaga litoralis]NYE24996.1 DNA-binding GntR family transcriptional regulator [Pigmentiphaga litoralis]NYE81390.1 DNA-binding GntR family transcriptional regulator [Pigmentiphaga litoralis]
MTTHPPLSAVADERQEPLADMVFGYVLDAIYDGELAPGSVVNEVALAQKFGVSRGPVREAVRRLQGIQLLTREPYVKARVVSLSAETALELFQMRMALEGMACSLATRRMSDADIAQLLTELQEERERERQAKQSGIKAPRVFDFHERVVKACGNQRIIHALCGDLYHLLRVYRRHSGTVLERKHDAYNEHWQILRAMQTRDADLAESLMRSHIERAAQHLFKHLIDAPAGAPAAQRA